MTKTNLSTCTVCQSHIPSGAPGGYCPACLLRDAAPQAANNGCVPPSLELLAAAFPNLKIEQLIGQGGMGFVFKAMQPSLDRAVALKILSPELGKDPAFTERFSREARTLGKLNHPNIVTIYETGESHGFYYLIMEYVDGIDLRQAMQLERFTAEQALALVPDICDALQSAHELGIWHRDIKPENILLDSQGKVKIADFGIARLVGDPLRDFTLTGTGARLGSAAYMAPEQHEKPHDVDHRADIYSLGVVIYEMLTGELPLGRFKAPSSIAAVDARIDEIVMRTLEKDRGLRHQKADELKTQVIRTQQTLPAKAAQIRNRPKWHQIAVVLLILCGIAWLIGHFWPSKGEETWEYTLRKFSSDAAMEAMINLREKHSQDPVEFSVEDRVVRMSGPPRSVRPLISMLRGIEQVLENGASRSKLTTEALPPMLGLVMMKMTSFDEAPFSLGLLKIFEHEKITAPQLARALSAHVWEWEKAQYKQSGEVLMQTLAVSVPCADEPEKPLVFTISGFLPNVAKISSMAPFLIDQAKEESAEPMPISKKTQENTFQ